MDASIPAGAAVAPGGLHDALAGLGVVLVGVEAPGGRIGPGGGSPGALDLAGVGDVGGFEGVEGLEDAEDAGGFKAPGGLGVGFGLARDGLAGDDAAGVDDGVDLEADFF